MSESRKPNPTKIIAIAAGQHYAEIHRRAKADGLSLKAYVLKKCAGVEPEPKKVKEPKPKKAAKGKAASAAPQA